MSVVFDVGCGRVVAGPCREVCGCGVEVVVLEESYCGCGLCLPVENRGVVPIRNLVSAVEVVLGRLRACQTIGVCCAGGCGRTGTVVSTVIMVLEGLGPDEAVERFFEEVGCGPESSYQLAFIHLFHSLYKKLGLEKTLRLLKLFEKPWVLELKDERLNLCNEEDVNKAKQLFAKLGLPDAVELLAREVKELYWC